MTKLSMLVLFADISHSMTVALILIGLVVLGISVIFTAWRCGGFDYQKHKEHFVLNVFCYIFAIITFVLGGLLPSKQTVYIIGGIEAINEFSKTEVAKELGDSGMSLVKDITEMVHIYTLEAIKEAKNDTYRR